MRRRCHNKKRVYVQSGDDQDYNVQGQDSLNQDYVQSKRAAKKGVKTNKKASKKHLKQPNSQQSNSNSQQILQFKLGDDQMRQHHRPSFIQRWNGVDNEIEIFSQEYQQMSPMFKVYWEAKARNMNAVIFVMVGRMEFFAFQNDAILLHQIFKKRLKKFSSFLMVNFWCKQIILAKQQLFDRGIPVLMMNEINDPMYKLQNGIIRRQIDEVITPGIHLDMEDKAYKQRWFMACYVVDVKEMRTRRMGSMKEEMMVDDNNRSQQAEQQLRKACVVLLDTQTNKFFIEQFDVDQKMHDVRRVINRYRPVEILLPKSSSSIYIRNLKQMARQICSPYMIQLTYQKQSQKVSQTLHKFMQHCKSPLFKQLLSLSTTTKRYDSSFQMFATIKCLDLIYIYLDNLKLKQKIFDEGLYQLASFNQSKLKPFFDSQVYENLQVFRIKNEDEGEGKKGTLVAYLDYCLTNSGKKLLRRWLNQPLVTIQAITQRQQCIKQIVQNPRYSQILTLHQKLIAYEKLQKNIADVYHWVVKGYQRKFHKLTGELSFEKGYDQKKNPAILRIKQIMRILKLLTEFQQYLHSLKQFNLQSTYFNRFTSISTSLTLKSAKRILKGQQILQQIPQISKIIQSITSKIDYNQVTDFLQPTAGHYSQYDKQKKEITRIQKQLQHQLSKWRAHFKNNKITYVHVRARNELQIPKLCLKSRKDKPKQLIFSSQTSTTERFTTARTIQLSQQLIIHQQRIAKSYEPFLNDVIDDFCQFKVVWNKYVEAISEIDVLFALAQVARRMVPRCLPKFSLDDQNSRMDIKKAFHPGLIQVLQPDCLVPNSLSMKNEQRFLLLTGPNMGGKSTLLRQTCLLAILAQIGSYLPCQYYQTIVFDQIFCRIGSSDRIIEGIFISYIQSGKSTFYVELEETHRILKQATSSSLVIIDQLGRGTSTYDGMAIAEATIEYILENIGCYALFSTHYTPITRDYLSHDEVRCAKMSYKLLQNDDPTSSQQRLQFLYQVEPGVAQKSFANNVARMVGLPMEILTQADKRATWISELHEEAEKLWKKTRNVNHLVELGIIEENKKQMEI